MAVAGAASFVGRARPERPEDLTTLACINLRLPTHGGPYGWEFEKAGREVRVRVERRLVFDTEALPRRAALQGLGIACLFEDGVRAHLESGTLVRVLEDWCEPFRGDHLYDPSRREPPTLAMPVEALRRDIPPRDGTATADGKAAERGAPAWPGASWSRTLIASRVE